MFGVVSQIIDFLLKAIPFIREERDRKRKRTFGQALLLAHIRLNEVISTGNTLVAQLWFFKNRYTEHLAKKDDWTFHPGYVESLLKTQAVNLIRLGHTVEPLTWELSAVVPEGWRIRELLRFKVGVVNGLYYHMLAGSMPFDAESVIQEQQIAEPARAMDWTDDMLVRVGAYLDGVEVGVHLKGLEAAAERMRAVLCENFSLDEILVLTSEFRDSTQRL